MTARLNPGLLTDALAHVEGPDWFAGNRRTALRRFLADGLPRSWPYTRLEHLARLPLHPPVEAQETVVPVEPYPGPLLAFQDHQLVWRDSGLAPDMVGDLADATDPMQARLGSLAGDASLALLNGALWRTGVLIRVPARERLRTPVCLRLASSQADAMLHPRLLVEMAADADAILVEHHVAETASPHWQNTVAEIFLEPGARLTHLRLVEGGAATHTHLVCVQQARDSCYRSLTLSLGGRVVRQEIRVDLAEPGAEARLDGLFIADGQRHADHRLEVRHAAPLTHSRLTWRGIAAGQGRGIVDSLVRLERAARQAVAQLSSHHLLLSPQAEVDALPQLEALADDLHFGQSTTVERLDEMALFFLASRGIDAAEARTMLLEAHVGEALGLAADAGLSDWLLPRLQARLADLAVEAARS